MTRVKCGLLLLCFTTMSFADTHWGVVNVPPEEAGSDATAVEAIKRALAPKEEACVIELVQAGEQDQTSPNTAMQIVTVKICGKKQKFSIQRSQTKPDNVLVSAKKI